MPMSHLAGLVLRAAVPVVSHPWLGHGSCGAHSLWRIPHQTRSLNPLNLIRHPSRLETPAPLSADVCPCVGAWPCLPLRLLRRSSLRLKGTTVPCTTAPRAAGAIGAPSDPMARLAARRASTQPQRCATGPWLARADLRAEGRSRTQVGTTDEARITGPWIRSASAAAAGAGASHTVVLVAASSPLVRAAL